jgi:hypothetical protein
MHDDLFKADASALFELAIFSGNNNPLAKIITMCA